MNSNWRFSVSLWVASVWHNKIGGFCMTSELEYWKREQIIFIETNVQDAVKE